MSNNKPRHKIRYGKVVASIWVNEGENGDLYSVTFECLYLKDGNWNSSNSFSRDDTLVLSKVANEANTWIHLQQQSQQANNQE